MMKRNEHVKVRRRLVAGVRRIGCGASVLALACACAAPTSAKPAAEPSAACRTSMGEAQALWDPLHDGTGGYGDTPSLAAPASLYLTAWSLQLAAATHTATNAIDRASVVRWLTAGATDPSTFSEDSELTPLARIELAASTLRAMGAPVPAGAARAVQALRSGTLYRNAATAKADWPATALATQTLAETGTAVAQPVLQAARAQASALKPALNVNDIGETGLPILTTLVSSEPRAATQALLPDLSALLQSWTGTIKAAGVSAATVGYLSDIHQVARAAGVSAPAVVPSFLAPLRTPGGYYGLGQGGSAGDPQITYDAVTLGATFPEQARTTLSLGQARDGWLAIESAPTPVDTYQAAVIGALCSGSAQHPLSSQLLSAWIASSTTSPAVSPAAKSTAPTDASATLAEACWLAREDQITLPSTTLRAEEQTLTAQVGDDARLPAAGLDLAAADACSATLPSSLLASLPHTLASATPATMSDALDLYMAGTTLGDSHLIDLARTAAAKLRTAAYTYRYNAKAPTPDIVSTAEGFVISSPPPPTVRAKVLAAFSTTAGPALTPVSSSSSGGSPTVTMASLAAAAILDTGAGNLQYLL